MAAWSKPCSCPKASATPSAFRARPGCAVDCKFCMTALLGLERSLTAGEIVGQVLTGGAR
jgi:23S rRNA (adenine2503-C2)-methyltransferase